MMVSAHLRKGADYTYVHAVLRGMDCEVVSLDLIRRAWKMQGDRNVEHLSYVLRHPDLNPRVYEYQPPENYRSKDRLSLDWPEDLDALRRLFCPVKHKESGPVIVQVLKQYPGILKINALPKVSVYTCAYNAERTLERTVDSVLNQTFKDFEYIFLDDGSTDKTSGMLGGYGPNTHIKTVQNEKNIGLAASCNRALASAKGTYALRIDADDELLPDALEKLVGEIERNGECAAIYPAYLRKQGGEVIQNTAHHMGGALVRLSVLRELQFCDGLRDLEGEEIFGRISSRFAVREYDQPTWIYHHTEGSLSNQSTPRRKRAKSLLNKEE